MSLPKEIYIEAKKKNGKIVLDAELLEQDAKNIELPEAGVYIKIPDEYLKHPAYEGVKIVPIHDHTKPFEPF